MSLDGENPWLSARIQQVLLDTAVGPTALRLPLANTMRSVRGETHRYRCLAGESFQQGAVAYKSAISAILSFIAFKSFARKLGAWIPVLYGTEVLALPAVHAAVSSRSLLIILILGILILGHTCSCNLDKVKNDVKYGWKTLYTYIQWRW